MTKGLSSTSAPGAGKAGTGWELMGVVRAVVVGTICEYYIYFTGKSYDVALKRILFDSAICNIHTLKGNEIYCHRPLEQI